MAQTAYLDKITQNISIFKSQMSSVGEFDFKEDIVPIFTYLIFKNKNDIYFKIFLQNIRPKKTLLYFIKSVFVDNNDDNKMKILKNMDSDTLVDLFCNFDDEMFEKILSTTARNSDAWHLINSLRTKVLHQQIMNHKGVLDEADETMDNRVSRIEQNTHELNNPPHKYDNEDEDDEQFIKNLMKEYKFELETSGDVLATDVKVYDSAEDDKILGDIYNEIMEEKQEPKMVTIKTGAQRKPINRTYTEKEKEIIRNIYKPLANMK